MFGQLVQKLQSLSPLASPTTSPTVSPKPRRKLGFGRSRKRKDKNAFRSREDVREVQSEPELEYDAPRSKSRDRRKTSAPAHAQAGPLSAAFSFSSVKKGLVDEPYPAAAHQDLESIYDVPARLRRKVDTPTPSGRKLEYSKTVGRMEGIKQV
ncbi:unnamed protein product, partial [Meganyctiphanes norvegica]